MVKGFSSEGHPERFTELHEEEEREEGDRGEQEEKKGIPEKRDRSRLYSIPYVFSAAHNTHRHSQNWTEKGEGGNRGDLGEKKENQKGERGIKPIITLLSTEGWIL